MSLFFVHVAPPSRVEAMYPPKPCETIACATLGSFGFTTMSRAPIPSWIGALRLLHVAPSSAETKIPLLPNAPYQVFGASGPAQQTTEASAGALLMCVHVAPASDERNNPNLRWQRKTSFGFAPETATQLTGSPATGTLGSFEERMDFVTDFVLLSGLTRQPSAPTPSHSPSTMLLPAPVAANASRPTSPL